MKDNYEKITKEETEKTKSRNRILDLWKDPVISKLIANWITYVVPIVLTLSYFVKETIFDFLKVFLLSDIKIYVLLIIVIISIILKYVHSKFFKRNKKDREYFKSKFIGNYRFADLNNILLTTFIEVPIHLQNIIGVKELDLLTFFRMYISHLNTGIGWNHPTDDGMFLYYKLGPKLMSYSLCEKVPSMDNNTEGNINSYDIQTSENGYKFFALLESYDRIYNIKNYEKEVSERQKK